MTVACVIEATVENEFKELNYTFRLLEVAHVFVNGTYRCFHEYRYWRLSNVISTVIALLCYVSIT